MPERIEYESNLNKKGYKYIIGLDEAGRGPMAGPLVVAGVIFPVGYFNDEINDSKKLSSNKRERLYNTIIRDCLDYDIEILTVKEVDDLNVYKASQTGMLRVIERINTKPDYALSDAMPLGPGELIAHEPIIKGDSKSISIAAASILAKVTRDRIMNVYDKIYPQYNFKKNKGYPTKEHKDALKKYGVTPIHRVSFKPVMDILYPQLTFDLGDE